MRKSRFDDDLEIVILRETDRSAVAEIARTHKATARTNDSAVPQQWRRHNDPVRLRSSLNDRASRRISPTSRFPLSRRRAQKMQCSRFQYVDSPVPNRHNEIDRSLQCHVATAGAADIVGGAGRHRFSA